MLRDLELLISLGVRGLGGGWGGNCDEGSMQELVGVYRVELRTEVLHQSSDQGVLVYILSPLAKCQLGVPLSRSCGPTNVIYGGPVNMPGYPRRSVAPYWMCLQPSLIVSHHSPIPCDPPLSTWPVDSVGGGHLICVQRCQAGVGIREVWPESDGVLQQLLCLLFLPLGPETPWRGGALSRS